MMHMVTYAELESEPWYRSEFAPQSLQDLRHRLILHFGLSPVAVGMKGDNNHLRGYHRSRAWILQSRFCTNRTYSVSRTLGDIMGGDANWLCAIDVAIDRARLLPMCRRLDIAVRAGLLEKVTEWYGNTDGDTRVDGYDNIANRVATSDDSHLWHLHVSLDRGRAGEDHTDLFNFLTGRDTPMTDPAHEQITWEIRPWLAEVLTHVRPLWRGTPGDIVDTSITGRILNKIDALAALIRVLPQAPPTVDPAELGAILAASLEFVSAVAEACRTQIGMIPTAQEIGRAVVDELDRRLGDRLP